LKEGDIKELIQEKGAWNAEKVNGVLKNFLVTIEEFFF